ncbi:extracellular solute-binding protein [Spirillospora sp. NBC_00431]
MRLRTAAIVTAVAMVTTLVVQLNFDRYTDGCERDPEDDNSIVMFSGEDVNPGRRRHELINTWNAEHPRGPKVELVELVGGADHEYSQLLAAHQLGSCASDVLSLDVVWTPPFARAGLLEPFPKEQLKQQFDQRNFLHGPWRTGTGDDGEQYAIPFHSDAPLLYYRRDIVGNSPPRTWDELRGMSSPENLARLRARDAAGIVTQLADYEGLTVNGLEIAASGGGTIGKDPRQEKITIDAAAERALGQIIKDFESSVIHGESLNFRENDSVAAFAQGRALFLRNWPYTYHVLHADPMIKDRFGTAQLPDSNPSTPGPGILGGQNLAVSRNSVHKKEAREFIEWITRPRQQLRLFACGGYVPVRTEVYANPEQCSKIPGQQPQSEPEQTELSDAELTKFARILRTAISQAGTRPDVPNYPGFSRAFHRRLHNSIVQGAAVDRRNFADYLTACAGWRPPGKDCP